MDVTEGGDDEAVTSSMVDDVFFIVQKAVRYVSDIMKLEILKVKMNFSYFLVTILWFFSSEQS